MDISKCKLDSSGEGSSPSAPPIVVPFEEATEHPLQLPVKRSAPLSRDANLVRDLLRKADGDTSKVAGWLETMGEHVTPEEVRDMAEGDFMGRHGDEVDVAAAQLNAPEMYFCPISFHLFRDPVLLPTGQTYERSVIQRWLAEGGSICPITGIELKRPVTLTPNHALRQAIEEWAARNGDWMLGPDGRLLPVPDDQKRHFSLDIGPEAGTESDANIALQLQTEEIERYPRNRAHPRNTTPNRPPNMTQAQYERVQRCTFILLIITILLFIMFLYTLYKGDWKFVKIDSNPLIGFGAGVLRQVGSTNTDLISDDKEWWRVITSSLMTAGVIHLQWVVCCLWICGRFLAARMSFFSFTLIYITSSVCGVLLSSNFSTMSETVSASGGVFGLIGAVVAEILVHRKHYRFHMASLAFVGSMAAVGVLMGMTPFVDNWTNLGGLVSGFCLAMALRLTHRGLQSSNSCIEWILVAVQVFWFLLVGLFVVMGIVGLYVSKESRQDCTWCKRLTCINVDWWDCDVAIVPSEDVDCHFDIGGDLKTTITCPSGFSQTEQLTDVTQKTLERYCDNICKVRSKRDGRKGSPPTANPVPEESTGVVFVPAPVSPSDEFSSSLEHGNVEQSTTE